MASCQTTRWVSTSPYAKLTVTLDSNASDGDTAVLNYTLQYISDYPASSGSRSYTIYIDGASVKTGTVEIDGVTGTKSVATGTKQISKTKSKQTISFKVSFTFNLTWSGVYGGTKTADGTIEIPAKTSYTITYNANGGSGAPSSQTKWFGTELKLSSTKPTRTGYSFQGWGLSASTTTVTYASGASYTTNASDTLYAVWKANTFSVKYDANGGSGAPGAQTKTYGTALTLSSTKPTRTNYTFKGWATSKGGAVKYQPGASYTANAAVTLYAVWELSYTVPRITSLSVSRCDSGGTSAEEGMYARVKCNWACDKTVSSIVIKWKLTSASTYPTGNSKTVTASGTSGSVNEVIGAGALSTENTYDIQITVTDASGNTSKRSTLNGLVIPIDILNGGKGVAFGKPAELSGVADIGFNTRMRKNCYFDNNTGLQAYYTDGTSAQLLNVNTNDNVVIGYGGKTKGIGATNIYGNVINLSANDGVFVNGLNLATSKVLWSGTYYMGSTQTCTLSEAISKQANGAVLVWSQYSDGASVNANFNFTFIPRRFVASHPEKGVTTVCSSATFNVVAAKYVYVHDTQLVGYDNNQEVAYTATCGITATPRYFVLRYVIGV